MNRTDEQPFEIVRIRRSAPRFERVRRHDVEPMEGRAPASRPCAAALWTAL